MGLQKKILEKGIYLYVICCYALFKKIVQKIM